MRPTNAKRQRRRALIVLLGLSAGAALWFAAHAVAQGQGNASEKVQSNSQGARRVLPRAVLVKLTSQDLTEPMIFRNGFE